MSWEALTAIATAATTLIILATALVAWHQVRRTTEQTAQAHRATQLEGMLRILEKLEDPQVLASRRYILRELAEEMRDPGFAERLDLPVDQRPWHHQMILAERMGVFTKMGLLDEEPFFYHLGVPIVQTVDALEPLIHLYRRRYDNPYLWKDTLEMRERALVYAERLIREDPRPRPSDGTPYRIPPR